MRPSIPFQSRHTRRRGVTIIEVLIAVSAVAIMMTLCAISIQLLLRLNADVQARYRAAVAIERLAQQVRDDAHASASARIAADPKSAGKPAGLHLDLEPDHWIDYASDDGGVVRTESRAGKVIRHETFSLPRGGIGHFELRDEHSHKLVALVVNHTATASKIAPPKPFEVVALQGKDRLRPQMKPKGKP